MRKLASFWEKSVGKNRRFLKIFGSIFFPVLLIITVIIVGFEQIEKYKMSTLIFLWIFLCGGVGIGCYLLVRGFMNRIQSGEQLAKHRDHLEKLVEARTGELEIANQLLQRSAERAHLVKEIASAANADDNTEEVLLVAIRSIAKNMQWPIGHVHVISSDNPFEMVSTTMWYLEDSDAYQEFVEGTGKIRYGIGIGMPGRVLLQKKTIIIEDIATSIDFPRAQIAANIGINAGFAFPVFVKGEVVAVLEFFAHQMAELGRDVVTFAEEIGEQISFLMERKQGEEALGIEQQKAQQYLNIAGSVIVVIDEDGNIKLVNKAGLKLLGYSEEELLGENWFMKVIPRHEQGISKQNIQEMLTTEDKFVEFYENLIRAKDGTEKLIAWHNVLIYDKNGKVTGVLSSGEDITEHRKADEELRKLSQAVEQSPVSVLITDRYGRIEYVNHKFCERTHYLPEEVIGRNPRILKSGSLPHSFYKELWQTIQSGHIWRGDFLNKTKEGIQYWERASISPVMDSLGQISNFIAIKEDITEQKKMEEELLQAKVEAEISNKAKGDFLANMSHEIRTPMNAVIGLTHLALETDLLPKQQDYLEKIAVSAQSLLGIIDDILDYSKFAAGKLTMENIQFNLWKVIEDTNTILNCKAEEKGLEMVLNVAKDVPMRLKGDPHRLKQILLNLLSNAVKFTKQGEVVLSVKLMSEKDERVQLEFSVRDTGIGMNEEERGRLFNAFTQADGSTTRKYGGTGLGLVISKQLVEMMGGAMHVKSSPGQGSEFVFTAEFGFYGADQLPLRSQYNLQNLKVLVIDDNESSRLAFKEILEKLTFVVSLAASGEEGLSQLLKYQDKEPFDLILLDWMMPPGIDGIETARRIRNHPKWATIPIIMVTSHSGQEIREEGEELNLDGLLIKPVTPSALFNATLEAVGKEKQHVENSSLDVAAPHGSWDKLQGARILLVEDNEINLQVAREIMEKKKIIVTIARNGREATELVRDRQFDAVLMDIQMPEMDGLEATDIIRSELGLKELPIIAMTADVVDERIGVYIDAGMNDCIFKPINITQMFNTICKWVRPQLIIPGVIDERIDLGVNIEAKGNVFELAGINVEKALVRLGGNKKLYHKILLEFLEKNGETIRTLQVALANEDYPLMESILHSLKGVAGNIGADYLYDAIRELEVGIRSKKTKRITEKMDLFSVGLMTALDSIRDMEDPIVHEDPQPAEGNLDIFNQSKEIMETLHDYLANYDTEATAVFDKLKKLPIATMYQGQFKKIQTSINKYDFEKALEQLKELNDFFCK